jgi:hypothetical protein
MKIVKSLPRLDVQQSVLAGAEHPKAVAALIN